MLYKVLFVLLIAIIAVAVSDSPQERQDEHEEIAKLIVGPGKGLLDNELQGELNELAQAIVVPVKGIILDHLPKES